MSGAWSDDRTLVDAVLRGEEAVQVLFGEGHCAPILRALAYRNHLRPDQFDELRQSFFLHVSKNHYHVLRTWKGTGKLKSYLWTTAINHYRRWCAKREPRITDLTDSDGGPVELDDESQFAPPRILVAAEKLSAALRVIEEMPERDRVIAYMAKNGCSHADIAAAVKSTPGAVAAALCRLRDRLDERLREGGHGDD